MFQEERWSQILCEHIGVVFRCGNGVNFNLAFLDLFSDIMVAYLNMLNPFLGYGILSVEDSSVTVTIDRDIRDRFPEFSEKNFVPCTITCTVRECYVLCHHGGR